MKSSARCKAVTPGVWHARAWKRSAKSCTMEVNGKRPNSVKRLPHTGAPKRRRHSSRKRCQGHAALVLFEGVVPCLGGPAEMVGCQPGPFRCGRALAAKELVTLVEPVKRVIGAVVRGEVDLGEPGRLLVWRALAHCLGGAEGG